MNGEWRIDRDENHLDYLLDECLEVFEGGDCLEDFDTSWVRYVVSDLVDLIRWKKKQIVQRKEGRAFIENLGRIRDAPIDGTLSDLDSVVVISESLLVIEGDVVDIGDDEE